MNGNWYHCWLILYLEIEKFNFLFTPSETSQVHIYLKSKVLQQSCLWCLNGWRSLCFLSKQILEMPRYVIAHGDGKSPYLSRIVSVFDKLLQIKGCPRMLLMVLLFKHRVNDELPCTNEVSSEVKSLWVWL